MTITRDYLSRFCRKAFKQIYGTSHVDLYYPDVVPISESSFASHKDGFASQRKIIEAMDDTTFAFWAKMHERIVSTDPVMCAHSNMMSPIGGFYFDAHGNVVMVPM